MMTRSIMHIMTTMAAQVEVPAEDVAEGRATPGTRSGQMNRDRPSAPGAHPHAQTASLRMRSWRWLIATPGSGLMTATSRANGRSPSC